MHVPDARQVSGQAATCEVLAVEYDAVGHPHSRPQGVLWREDRSVQRVHRPLQLLVTSLP